MISHHQSCLTLQHKRGGIITETQVTGYETRWTARTDQGFAVNSEQLAPTQQHALQGPPLCDPSVKAATTHSNVFKRLLSVLHFKKWRCSAHHQSLAIRTAVTAARL
jgi:hypothetical protein